MDAAVLGARVEVLLSRGGGWGEVTADKRFEDSVARVGCYTAVVWVTFYRRAGVVLHISDLHSKDGN